MDLAAILVVLPEAEKPRARLLSPEAERDWNPGPWCLGLCV